MNPNHPSGEIEMSAAQTAARALRKEMLVFRASNELELDAAFTSMAQHQIGALVVAASDPVFWSRRSELASLAARYRLPTIYYLPEFARAGGLMAYGNNLVDMYIAWSASMSAGFSKGRSLVTCQLCNPRSSNL